MKFKHSFETGVSRKQEIFVTFQCVRRQAWPTARIYFFMDSMPRIKINTSPTNYRGYNQMQLVKFDGKRWVPFGEIIGE